MVTGKTMGTNYYTKTKKCPECGHKPEGIHLGKSSMGWKFAFQYNGGQYYKSVEEMKEWLKDKEIENEYGEKMSHEEFWNMVDIKQGEKNERDSHVMDLGGYEFIDEYFS